MKEKYLKEARKEMKEKFGYSNVMQVPKIEKVVINTGFGRTVIQKTKDEQKKFQEYIVGQLTQLIGQKPVLTSAKQSISSFKLREGNIIGAKATLRGKKMYDFLERLTNVVLPRSRDFKGVDFKSIDPKGNLNMGIKEHIAFPEISPEKANLIFGLQITVKTTAKSREEAEELFRLLDFPLKKR